MILSILNKLEPLFSKGGKFERLYPLFEGTSTFFYTPGKVTHNTTTHVRDFIDFKRMMIMVFFAVFPCMFWGWFNIGNQTINAIQSAPELMKLASASFSLFSENWHYAIVQMLGGTLEADAGIYSKMLIGFVYFLPIYAVSFGVGAFWEVLFCIIRKHEVNEGLFVTSLFFALIVPPTIPLWQVALGISFGVIIGKEVFGGTGRNFMNPALVGRAFLFFAYPAQISGDAVWVPVDGYTGATALSFYSKNGHLPGNMSFVDAFIGNMPGCIGEVSTLGILIGGIALLLMRISSSRIVIGGIIGLIIMTIICNMFVSPNGNPMLNMHFHEHLVLGGFAFGIFFMATDPVSAAFTGAGKWAYGILIGAMVVLIRVVNPAYPEGVMLAILFANCWAPLFDYAVSQIGINRRKRIAARPKVIRGE